LSRITRGRPRTAGTCSSARCRSSPVTPPVSWFGTHTTGGWSGDAARITAALESKAERYGALDAPLVIAVLSNSAYGTDDIDFDNAL
jgi:hypothetical protein